MTNIKIVETEDGALHAAGQDAFPSRAQRPSRQEAEEAVRTLIRWAGDDPRRPGLVDTPSRVARAYEEFFAGYGESAAEVLGRTFEDIVGYDDFVLVKNIDFLSHCEHHIVPITGHAHVAYMPGEKVVGISKLARVVDIFARRLVSQENMTQEIVRAIEQEIAPRGVAVVIDAAHHCMSRRGVSKVNSSTVTSAFTGVFKEDGALRTRFLEMTR